ncbi:GyrI-like domain-containing protein [Aquimarina macrocephali]|uniref:GyrI-like domain-containing protein n=1 Tax=Aquimarina macrocephali TaxID=666563 RepID=UPI000463C09B|nr:GyrI-like domain-containing protein [Aquimarina macrocephali]
MIKTKIEPFWIVGISVRTTKKNEQFANDIPNLWNTFMSEGTMHKIPNKLEDSIYAVYTDYESDHTEGYTTIIGCKVANLDNIPPGMTSVKIERSIYSRFTAKGDITKGVIYDKWVNIWEIDLDRTYTTDFEVYGEDAVNPTNAEVDIFVAIE